MIRLTTIAVALLVVSSIAAQPRRENMDLRSTILDLRLTPGRDTFNEKWNGAFKDSPRALGFRYYFVSDGLRSLATDQTAAPAIEAYLNHCLARADENTGLWDDVPDFRVTKTYLVDADDSNIALLLLLATDFHSTPQGRKWWSSAHATKLKQLARNVLLGNRLPNGLVSVYSRRRNFDDPKWDPPRRDGQSDADYAAMVRATRASRKALQKSAYLMDSCEVWASLNALAAVLNQLQDKEASDFSVAAAEVAKGISGLYQQEVGAFFILDTDKRAFPGFYVDGVKFYPHRAAQVFPQLYNVTVAIHNQMGPTPYDRAWKFANANHDWQVGMPADGSAGGFPWMVRGFIAMKRGDRGLARQYLDWYCDEMRAPSPNPAFQMINETGYALRIETGLKSRR